MVGVCRVWVSFLQAVVVAFIWFSGSEIRAQMFTRVTTGPVVTDHYTSFGASWGDYNNDGYPDLLVTGVNEPEALYRNTGNGNFVRVSVGVLTSGTFNTGSSSWVDFDNDGLLDIVTANWVNAGDRFYQNTGSSFTLVGTSLGWNNGGAAWADYDLGGDLDLVTTNQYGGHNNLYRNNGNGTFTNIMSDGDPYLFIRNLIGGHYFFYRNGNSEFIKITDTVINEGVGGSGSWGDYDNDGDLDLFESGSSSKLYRNMGNGVFIEVTEEAGFAGTVGFGTWVDTDNDGDLDLYQLSGLFLNNGEGTFSLDTESGIVVQGTHSQGSAWADFDRDGDQDLFITNYQDQNEFFINNGNSNHWINILLKGVQSNASAVGARIYVEAVIDGQTVRQMREINTQSRTRSQDSLNAAFGLGDATIIDQIRIQWPSGIVQILTDVDVKQFMVITEEATCPPDGLIAWWTGEGHTLDEVGDHHGVARNGVTFASGINGQAFLLDGVNDYIKIPSIDIRGLTQLTLSAWVKSPSTGAQSCARILEIGENLGTSTALVLDADCGAISGTVRAWTHSNGSRVGHVGTVGTGYNYNDNQWHYLVFTYDGHATHLYVDGLLVDSNTATGPIDSEPVGIIGSQNSSTPYKDYYGGLIDNVAIFNRALTAEEIQTNYQMGGMACDNTDITPPLAINQTIDYDSATRTVSSTFQLNEQGAMEMEVTNELTGQTLGALASATATTAPYSGVTTLVLAEPAPPIIRVATVAADQAGNETPGLVVLLETNFSRVTGTDQVTDPNTGVHISIVGDVIQVVGSAQNGRPSAEITVGSDGGPMDVTFGLTPNQELSQCGAVGGCELLVDGVSIPTTREVQPDGSVLYHGTVTGVPGQTFRADLGFDPNLGGAGVLSATDPNTGANVSFAGDGAQTTIAVINDPNFPAGYWRTTITAGTTGGSSMISFTLSSSQDLLRCGSQGACSIVENLITPLVTTRTVLTDGRIRYSAEVNLQPGEVRLYSLKLNDVEGPVIDQISLSREVVRPGDTVLIYARVRDSSGVYNIVCIVQGEDVPTVYIPMDPDPDDPERRVGTYTPGGGDQNGDGNNDGGPVTVDVVGDDGAGNSEGNSGPGFIVDPEPPTGSHPRADDPETGEPVDAPEPGDCVHFSVQAQDVHSRVSAVNMRIVHPGGQVELIPMLFDDGLWHTTYCFPDEPGPRKITFHPEDPGGNSAPVPCHDLCVSTRPVVDAGEPFTINEGQIAQFSGSFTDPDEGDTHTFYWDFGNGDMLEDELNPQIAYGDDGDFPAQLVVTDACGRIDFDFTTVTVENLDPELTLHKDGTVIQDDEPTYLIGLGDTLELIADGADPGSDDLIFTWTWDRVLTEVKDTYYNDGQGPDPSSSPGPVFPFSALDSAAFIFTRPGVYFLTLTLSDDDGGQDTDTLRVMVRPHLRAGITANNHMFIYDNALVDSFNSCNGPYGGGNIGTEGHVWVGGDLTLQPNAVVTGTQTQAVPTGLEPMPVPLGLVSSGDLNLTETLVLPPGDYLYHNMNLQGQSQLVGEGSVRIWFSGSLNIQSGATVEAWDGVPENLWLISGGGSNLVELQSNSALTGVLYAPDRPVTIQSNAQVYGALAGEDVTFMGNAMIHYDTALLTGYCQGPPVSGPVPTVTTAADAANGTLTIQDNALVDSYDACVGPYGGANMGSAGDVRASGAIQVQPNAIVLGNQIANAPSGAENQPIPAGNTTSGDLNLNSALTLAAGDYLFHNIDLQSGAQLQGDGGLVRIWFTGRLTVGGGAQAGDAESGQLWFFDAGGTDHVTLQSGAVLRGMIHTPYRPITVQSNATVYGALTGATIHLMGNSQLHYDASLAEPCE